MAKLSIEITLKDSQHQEEIYIWNLVDTPVSLLWFKLLAKEVSTNKKMFLRYTGLENKRSNLTYFIKTINEVLSIIKNDFNTKSLVLPQEYISREDLNSLHHIFEGNYGSVNNESEVFKNASPQGQAALCALNHLVHDYETWDKRNNGNSEFFSIVGEFSDPLRVSIPSAFETAFTLELEPGTLALHYGVVGKQWHEVFVDDDDVIPEEAIIPLNMTSGEFDLIFANNIFDKNQQSEFEKFLKNKGLTTSDHGLNIGFLPLAKPQEKKTVSEWEQIFSSKEIDSISLKQDDNIIGVLNIDCDYESPFTSFLKISATEENDS